MKTRRVVTGHNQDGRSVVKWDSVLESKPGRERYEKVELWAMDSLPARLTELSRREPSITGSIGGPSRTWWPLF